MVDVEAWQRFVMTCDDSPVDSAQCKEIEMFGCSTPDATLLGLTNPGSTNPASRRRRTHAQGAQLHKMVGFSVLGRERSWLFQRSQKECGLICGEHVTYRSFKYGINSADWRQH